MADVVVAGANEVVYLTAGTAIGHPTGQTVGTGDTAVITPAAASGPVGNGFKGRYLLLSFVENGTQTDTTYTVENGPTGGTPANLAAYGDSAASGSFSDAERELLVVDLARYLQADGTVRVLVGGTAGASLSVSAIVMDRRV